METNDEKRMRSECYGCQHRRDVPGDAHIRCAKPDAQMVGNPHGIRHGWFYYPMLFDPTWKERLCNNYTPVVSEATSQAVSHE